MKIIVFSVFVVLLVKLLVAVMNFIYFKKYKNNHVKSISLWSHVLVY